MDADARGCETRMNYLGFASLSMVGWDWRRPMAPTMMNPHLSKFALCSLARQRISPKDYIHSHLPVTRTTTVISITPHLSARPIPLPPPPPPTTCSIIIPISQLLDAGLRIRPLNLTAIRGHHEKSQVGKLNPPAKNSRLPSWPFRHDPIRPDVLTATTHLDKSSPFYVNVNPSLVRGHCIQAQYAALSTTFRPFVNLVI
jgi:hypothetical protein